MVVRMVPRLTVALVTDPISTGGAAGLPDADVFVFPELLDGGYARLARERSPHQSLDGILRSFRRMSADRGCTVVAGSVAMDNGRTGMTNTALVFTRGRRIHRYDKIHLFRPCNDHVFFRPGKSVRTFSFPCGGGRLKGGVVICYDLRFPELVRLLALQGLQVLFVPSRWPSSRDEAWRTLLKARAIENQIFVVGCDARGEEGGFSYAFDPFGDELLSSRDNPDSAVHRVELNLKRISEAHRRHQNVREAVILRSLARKIVARK
jgi:predicted amidohydrolase